MTNRLIREYAGSGRPIFVEGVVFKAIIPLPESKAANDTVNDTVKDTVNDTVNDNVSNTIKERLVQIVKQVGRNPGIRINELADENKVSVITIKRDLQKIRALVEFRGSQKAGGYFLTELMQSRIIDDTE